MVLKYLPQQRGRVAKLVSRPLSMRKVPGSKPGMSISFSFFFSFSFSQIHFPLNEKEKNEKINKNQFFL